MRSSRVNVSRGEALFRPEQSKWDWDVAMEACCNKSPPSDRTTSLQGVLAREEPVVIDPPEQDSQLKDNIISSFCELTNVTRDVAINYLESCNWNAHQAVNCFMNVIPKEGTSRGVPAQSQIQALHGSSSSHHITRAPKILMSGINHSEVFPCRWQAAPVAPVQQSNASSPYVTGYGAEAEDNTGFEDSEFKSVYVRNLPSNTSTSEIEEEFKNFGRIKPDDVFLRTRKDVIDVCYAFVEFEDMTSIENAIKASPIYLCGRQVYIEERRPNPAGVRGAS